LERWCDVIRVIVAVVAVAMAVAVTVIVGVVVMGHGSDMQIYGVKNLISLKTRCWFDKQLLETSRAKL
jgi:hypothetical protein